MAFQLSKEQRIATTISESQLLNLYNFCKPNRHVTEESKKKGFFHNNIFRSCNYGDVYNLHFFINAVQIINYNDEISKITLEDTNEINRLIKNIDKSICQYICNNGLSWFHKNIKLDILEKAYLSMREKVDKNEFYVRLPYESIPFKMTKLFQLPDDRSVVNYDENNNLVGTLSNLDLTRLVYPVSVDLSFHQIRFYGDEKFEIIFNLNYIVLDENNLLKEELIQDNKLDLLGKKQILIDDDDNESEDEDKDEEDKDEENEEKNDKDENNEEEIYHHNSDVLQNYEELELYLKDNDFNDHTKDIFIHSEDLNVNTESNNEIPISEEINNKVNRIEDLYGRLYVLQNYLNKEINELNLQKKYIDTMKEHFEITIKKKMNVDLDKSNIKEEYLYTDFVKIGLNGEHGEKIDIEDEINNILNEIIVVLKDNKNEL